MLLMRVDFYLPAPWYLTGEKNIPAPSMQRHTMRVVLVIGCIKLVLDAIRDWANVYYLIIKKLYGEVLINNT